MAGRSQTKKLDTNDDTRGTVVSRPKRNGKFEKRAPCLNAKRDDINQWNPSSRVNERFMVELTLGSNNCSPLSVFINKSFEGDAVVLSWHHGETAVTLLLSFCEKIVEEEAAPINQL